MTDVALENMMQWVSAIADNIRNPVAGMSAALEIMMREIDQRRRTGCCNEALIDDACHRMRSRCISLQEYITELVDFGRPLLLYRRPIAVGTFFSDLDHDLKQTAADYGPISMRIDISNDAFSVMCEVDQRRLGAACKALVRNASEASLYSKNPYVDILVEKGFRSEQAGIWIHIEDNGPGFNDGYVPRVFEPFFSTKEAGTGLGLSLAQRYVETHDGTLILGRSQRLGGAKVSVWLPASKQFSVSLFSP